MPQAAVIRTTLMWLEAVQLLPPLLARMLELGCGNGMSSSYLMAKRGFEIHGIDISHVAIDWARERFAQENIIGNFHHGDVRSMPFFSNCFFDLVFDGSCLHCLIGEGRDRCLREVRRILRPRGVFVVSSMCGAPKSEDALRHFDPATGHLRKDGKPYRTLKAKESIEAELSPAGFRLVCSSLNVNPWWDHATIVSTH